MRLVVRPEAKKFTQKDLLVRTQTELSDSSYEFQKVNVKKTLKKLTKLNAFGYRPHWEIIQS